MACVFPYLVANPKSSGMATIPVPCGRCYDCRMRTVNQWAFRLQQEDLNSISSLFVTLTYNTDYVPITNCGYMSLNYRDVQLFWKRLRKSMLPTPLKYFVVGEYGTKKMRPHYHAIIFNSNEELIAKAWHAGEYHIGQVTGASIAYTLKYMMKDSKIPMHHKDDREKEFRKMSKGLGENYLSDEIQKFHKQRPNDLFIRTGKDHLIAMPRFYRNKLWTEAEQAKQNENAADFHQKIQSRAEKEHEKKLNKKSVKTSILTDYEREISQYKNDKAIRLANGKRSDH